MKAPFKWEGSIPDRQKFLSDRPNTTNDIKRSASYFRDQKASSSLLQVDSSKLAQVQIAPDSFLNQVPYYSIKYLGVTRGQIGILSKRAPIPYISPLEACKDVPLVLINTSTGASRSSNRILNKLISIPAHVEDKSEASEEVAIKEIEAAEEFRPDPEAYDEFVIHKYARPNGLSTVRKEVIEEDFQQKHKPINIPYHRVGISGWKLSRPTTAKDNYRAQSSRKLRKKVIPKIMKRKYEMPEFHNEPYLKFLADKRKHGCRSGMQ